MAKCVDAWGTLLDYKLPVLLQVFYCISRNVLQRLKQEEEVGQPMPAPLPFKIGRPREPFKPKKNSSCC